MLMSPPLVSCEGADFPWKKKRKGCGAFYQFGCYVCCSSYQGVPHYTLPVYSLAEPAAAPVPAEASALLSLLGGVLAAALVVTRARRADVESARHRLL